MRLFLLVCRHADAGLVYKFCISLLASRFRGGKQTIATLLAGFVGTILLYTTTTATPRQTGIMRTILVISVVGVLRQGIYRLEVFMTQNVVQRLYIHVLIGGFPKVNGITVLQLRYL